MAEMIQPPPLTETTPAPAARRMLGLRVALIVAALYEAWQGYSGLSVLPDTTSHIPGGGIGGALITAQIVSHLPLALAALVYAALGRVRDAIIAMAAIVVMTWLNDMPSVVGHGFDFNGLGGLDMFVQIIAFPLMAACAIALARRNERLGLATALVTVPTLVNVLGVVAFALAISIHGF